ncbi:hypothetical protein PMI26_03807 [Pseudomonas sp. GM33]|nr:hypothetical protein PMI26_03807 [Pseudomonas sp. GM33]MDP9653468.1 hypothetical protein [Pseudomonas putida]
MIVNDDAGWQVPRGGLGGHRRIAARSKLAPTKVCVRKQREKYLKIAITRGNTSISRVNYIQHLTLSIEWYNAYLRGTYHINKTREISWHAAV